MTMAKTLKATILMLSEAPDGQPGVAGRAMAKYIVGDGADASVNQVKFKELAAPDLARPAGELFASAVAAIKVDEGIG
jgi:hypothetical protein